MDAAALVSPLIGGSPDDADPDIAKRMVTMTLRFRGKVNYSFALRPRYRIVTREFMAALAIIELTVFALTCGAFLLAHKVRKKRSRLST